MIGAHALVDLFAAGRSYSKVFLFFGYMSLLFGLLAYFFHGKAIVSNLVRYKKILVGLVGFNFVLNIGSFIWFAAKYHFKLTDFIITFNNAELSTTELIHNHVLKGIIAIGAQFFHHGVYQNMDSGTAFLHLVPTPFYIIALVVFLATIIVSIFYFIGSLGEYRHVKDGVVIGYVFLYGIVTFSVFKNIVDGGFFNYETVPALLFFLALLFYSNKKAHKTSIAIGVLYLGSIIGLYCGGFFSKPGQFFWYSYQSISLALLMGSLFYYVHKKKCDRLGILIILLTVIALAVPLSNESAFITYRSFVLPESGAVVGMYQSVTDPDLTPITSVGNFNFYSMRQGASEHKTIGDSIDRYGLLDNLYPIDIPWVNCIPPGKSLSYSFFLSTPDTFILTSTSSIISAKSVFVEKVGGWNRYMVSASITQCYPQPLTIMYEFFRLQGISTFFIHGFSVQTNDQDFH
jgi:hypothetical protein